MPFIPDPNILQLIEFLLHEGMVKRQNKIKKNKLETMGGRVTYALNTGDDDVLDVQHPKNRGMASQFKRMFRKDRAQEPKDPLTYSRRAQAKKDPWLRLDRLRNMPKPNLPGTRAYAARKRLNTSLELLGHFLGEGLVKQRNKAAKRKFYFKRAADTVADYQAGIAHHGAGSVEGKFYQEKEQNLRQNPLKHQRNLDREMPRTLRGRLTRGFETNNAMRKFSPHDVKGRIKAARGMRKRTQEDGITFLYHRPKLPQSLKNSFVPRGRAILEGVIKRRNKALKNAYVAKLGAKENRAKAEERVGKYMADGRTIHKDIAAKHLRANPIKIGRKVLRRQREDRLKDPSWLSKTRVTDGEKRYRQLRLVHIRT